MLIAESFGGKDEPVDALVSNFVDVGLDPVFDPLRVKDIPTESTYQAWEETGTDLAQLLTAKVSAPSCALSALRSIDFGSRPVFSTLGYYMHKR